MTDRSTSGAERHLDILRQVLALLPVDLVPAQADPPPSLLAGAEWVQDWSTMDAELADLTYDSSVDLELTARAGGGLRELTFVSGGRTIEMEIGPEARHVTVNGTVRPPVGGSVQLLVSGELFAADLDASGAFEVRDVPYGTVLAFIDTPEGKIRLGVFEV
jgi:hypothetical protein